MTKVAPGRAVLRHQLTAMSISVSPGNGGSLAAPVISGELVAFAGDAGVVGASVRGEGTLLERAAEPTDRFKAVPGNVRLYVAGEQLLVAGEAQWISGGSRAWRLQWIDPRTAADTKTIEIAEVTHACVDGDRLILQTRPIADEEDISVPRTTESGTEWDTRKTREWYESGEYAGVYAGGQAIVLSCSTGEELARIDLLTAEDHESYATLHAMRDHVIVQELDADTGDPRLRAHRISDGEIAWRRDGSLAAAHGDHLIVRHADTVACVGVDGADGWQAEWLADAWLGVSIGHGLVALVGDPTTAAAPLPYKQAIARSLPLQLRDAATGDVRWSTDDGVNRVAAIDERFVWAHDPKDQLIALTIADGTRVATVAQKGAESIAAADGVVAFVRRAKKSAELFVYAVEAS